MFAEISQHKKIIDQYLLDFLSQKEKELSRVNPWGGDAIEKLKSFVIAGKTVRGGLVCFSYLFFKNKLTTEVLQAAGSLELLHSGLLIHDDIMDGDTTRRGSQAIHCQFGENIGMCFGDLAFFLAMELLPPAVMPLVGQEFAAVCVAQMQDVAAATFKEKLSRQSLIALYRFKTGRYTISLPLAVGSLLAGQNPKIVKSLGVLGEDLGVLYQVRDDQLDKTAGLSSQEADMLLRQVNNSINNLTVSAQAKKKLLELSRFIMLRKK